MKAPRSNRVKVLAGRIFNPADPRAVMISPVLADRARVGPGGTLHLIGYPQRGVSPDIAHAVPLAFRVSAIVEFVDGEIVPANSELAEPRVLLSPAFARTRLAQSFNPAAGGGYVVLRPGPAPPRSPARPRRLPGVTGWGTSRSSIWPPSTGRPSGPSGRRPPPWRSSPGSRA